ncbi:DUF1365 domain-containing protein [Burkholderia glumae]|uniref:DUF1365 domain-containing protein n=1 Tax=Burkholderia glumae TaxID=337 RepID=UPI0020371665|nr:DUF1365 domain-containing protein [Burkholderia glumae]MCM2485525.1 DUF1365 domain-containing protein [Burkholderia glumae]MCM2511219.1 DUF1365 domain-containing protein [Burkholderia glumae]
MSAPFARDGSAARLLVGHVMHERLRPVRHAFRYALFQVCCDVERLDELHGAWFGIDRWRPLGLATRDYGPRDGQPLGPWLRARLAEAGIPADGPIWLQTIPRIFGYAFNPVSFWYCYDRQGRLRALYADVRNTFGAHHGYLLSAPHHAPIRDATELRCRKTFHVSPFCDVAGDYAFRMRQRGDHLAVAIDYRDERGLLLRTAIAMRAGPLSVPRALGALARQPLNAINVVVRIHWQALRLWLRRVPFHGKTPPALRLPAAPAASPAPQAGPSPRSDHEVRP